MSSPSQVLKMKRGDDFAFDIFVVDPATGEPRDISGTQMWFTAKSSLFDEDPEALISKTETDGIAFLNPTEGHARVSIDAADTVNYVKEQRLRFDVQWKDDNDFIHTISEGDLVVSLDVTQAS